MDINISNYLPYILGAGATLAIGGVCLYYRIRPWVFVGNYAANTYVNWRTAQLERQEASQVPSHKTNGPLVTYTHISRENYKILTPSIRDATALNMSTLEHVPSMDTPLDVIYIKYKSGDMNYSIMESVIAFLGPQKDWHAGHSKPDLTFEDIMIHSGMALDSAGKVHLARLESFHLEEEVLDPKTCVSQSIVLQKAIEHSKTFP